MLEELPAMTSIRGHINVFCDDSDILTHPSNFTLNFSTKPFLFQL